MYWVHNITLKYLLEVKIHTVHIILKNKNRCTSKKDMNWNKNQNYVLKLQGGKNASAMEYKIPSFKIFHFHTNIFYSYYLYLHEYLCIYTFTQKN